MIVFVLVAAAIMTAIGIGYLVLGRNRYGAIGSCPRKRLSAAYSANSLSVLTPAPRRRVRVYFIKPSRYDDQGYVEYFRWGVQPNNTLTVLAALNDSFNREHASKLNVHLETVIWDEVCDGAIGPETVAAIN